ncbi:MAG: ImmA/IrrE family metallo-endopeptidase [Dehalococcoidia bacterium]|nr:ImmA/IrrE family metallo-endopeptidase [Dehalococcoidia bacterium]
MPKGVPALVKPGLLRWARQTAGFDVAMAAKKAKVDALKLESWEQGTSRPSIPQLRKIAKVYQRPIAVFYLPEPPQGFTVPKDYRRTASNEAHGPSPELMLEMREAQARRELFEELFLQTEGDAPSISLTADVEESPESVGDRLRSFLHVSLQDQSQWKEPYDGLHGWRSAFERAGILVFQMSDVPSNEARGFSVFDQSFPLAVVNAKDSPSGRTFTLLHELTHLALRQGGICDLADAPTDRQVQDQVEVFCNAVAGATLMPREDFLKDETVLSHDPGWEWTNADIQKIARRFTCSNEAAVRRLADLGRVSVQFYQVKRREYQAKNGVTTAKKSDGFLPPYQKALSNWGPMFTRIALDNYYQGNITGSDLADLLGIRLKHLSRLEENLKKLQKRV